MQPKANVRKLWIAAGGLVLVFSTASPQAHPHNDQKQSKGCPEQHLGPPLYYYEGVVEYIRPPRWHVSLVRISLGREKKLMLETDGPRALLWMDTIETSDGNVSRFLRDLADSCKLPSDPRDAAQMLKVRWDSRELTRTQFGQFHTDFTIAATRYISEIQESYSARMATGMMSFYVHTPQIPIVYDNSDQHIELVVWAHTEGSGKKEEPILEWVHDLRDFAEHEFHQRIWREQEP